MDNKTKPLNEMSDDELISSISLHLKRANLACDKLDTLISLRSLSNKSSISKDK